jgi:hypothetical protein
MNTNELIERLAQSLAPVKPLWRPGKRAVAWLLGAATYVALLALSISEGGTLSNPEGRGLLLTQIVAIATCFLASRAAFASVIPGYAKTVLVWPVLAAAVWLATLVWLAPWQTEPATVLAARHEWWCVGVILVGGAPLLGALVVMLRRGAAFTPATTGALAALAVGALANIAACFWRPHPNDDITLVWHGSAILALVLMCVCGAGFVLGGRGRRGVTSPATSR